MTEKFTGQWFGTSSAGPAVLVNLAQEGFALTGRVSLFEEADIAGQNVTVCLWYYFEGKVQDDGFIEGTANLISIHDKLGSLLTKENLEAIQEAGFEFPNETTFRGKKSGDYEFSAEWASSYPTKETTKGQIILERKPPSDSNVTHEEMSWNTFKEHALEQKEGTVFRGQARPWRLQTSFHRTGHADLIAYLDRNIPELENHVNAYSRHAYNVLDDRSLGALLNLAQHHGYPTPLLDWTRSPYVAAFFAFENEASLLPDGSISIFMFDEAEWVKMMGRQAPLRVPAVMVKMIELPGLGNERVLPQQAMTMYSNVDDIEAILQPQEDTAGQLLKAVSIPAAERDKAMRDLSLMGITWGSMFPGLDGICKQLSSRHFK
ncbi:FRG domain-containing protein [Pseudoalteromonas sp. DL2-H2.2]|uniref:FRG domain-containing protein n=1 Tax=Pseudoalteromonas sp. DL2-H2.2 TaxID=2908889 RepID=UPI001F1C184E|nr:FRG domain-containing protein [Pseudoalteromonas sp. DL2-H2.2]MCF2909212.1 FRG domain-containing protein [Pseudoalteromonas sp. DL2-H2.2]